MSDQPIGHLTNGKHINTQLSLFYSGFAVCPLIQTSQITFTFLQRSSWRYTEWRTLTSDSCRPITTSFTCTTALPNLPPDLPLLTAGSLAFQLDDLVIFSNIFHIFSPSKSQQSPRSNSSIHSLTINTEVTVPLCRFFVRSIIRHANFFTKEASFDYMEREGKPNLPLLTFSKSTIHHATF